MTAILARALLALVCLLNGLGARAGELGREDIVRRFGLPLIVGEQPADLPVWPIRSELTPEGPPVACPATTTAAWCSTGSPRPPPRCAS